MRKKLAEAEFPGDDEPARRDFVGSLQKGLQVLASFGRETSRQTVSDVARRTGTTPASARRSLHTLAALGYLEGDGKHFWVAPRTLLLAHAYLASRPTPQLAQPLLDALSERTRESATLGQLLDDDVLIVARSTARRSLSTGLGIGARLPVYCSALGRALLSTLPPDEVARRVRAMDRRPLTTRTIHRAEEVVALVERCRAEGWAFNDGELEVGVRSMAVPLHDREGRPAGALSIAVRSERMTMREFRDEFLPALRKARDTLGRRLVPG